MIEPQLIFIMMKAFAEARAMENRHYFYLPKTLLYTVESHHEGDVGVDVLPAFSLVLFAAYGGTKLLRNMSERINSMDDETAYKSGAMLEMQVCARIRDGSVTFYDKHGVETTFPGPIAVWQSTADWPKIPNALVKCVTYQGGCRWYKLSLRNLGGYDTVFIDRVRGSLLFFHFVKPDQTCFTVQLQHHALFVSVLLRCAVSSAKAHFSTSPECHQVPQSPLFVLRSVDLVFCDGGVSFLERPSS